MQLAGHAGQAWPGLVAVPPRTGLVHVSACIPAVVPFPSLPSFFLHHQGILVLQAASASVCASATSC
jgi:hypothetical protein